MKLRDSRAGRQVRQRFYCGVSEWSFDPPECRFNRPAWESMTPKTKAGGNGGLETVTEPVESAETDTPDEGTEDRGDMVATVATVAVVGVAAAAFEVALLPGIILGVAAVAVPRYFPKIGAALNPLFRSTVRGAYQLGR